VLKNYFVVFWVMTPCSLVVDTNVLKHYIAPIFKFGVKILKMNVECSLEMLILTYQTIRCLNLKDHNMKFQCQYNTKFDQNVSKAKHDDR
jgi:hypothetical protein